MAEVDPIQALRDLSRKRFIELATELKPKTRQALKSLFDGVIDQLALLKDAATERGANHPAKAAPRKKAK
jgi:hypothetical protein